MSQRLEQKAGWRHGVGYLAAAIGYLAAVFALSHVPGSLLRLDWKIWDKAIHCAEYVPVGFLIGGWLAHRSWAPRTRILLVVTAALAVAALGLFDELHQHFVPGRDATLGDVLADALGGLIGAVVVVLVFSARGRLGAANPSGSRTT
jgi:VanZ family protein